MSRIIATYKADQPSDSVVPEVTAVIDVRSTETAFQVAEQFNAFINRFAAFTLESVSGGHPEPRSRPR